jgi:hypothetical protein
MTTAIRKQWHRGGDTLLITLNGDNITIEIYSDLGDQIFFGSAKTPAEAFWQMLPLIELGEGEARWVLTCFSEMLRAVPIPDSP